MGVAPRASCGPRGSCGKQGSGMQVGRGETKAVPLRLAVVGARALVDRAGAGCSKVCGCRPGVDLIQYVVGSDEKFDTRFAVVPEMATTAVEARRRSVLVGDGV